jgi:hypothetical protein
MGTKIILPSIVASVLLASTSAHAADLVPLHSPVMAGYEVDTPDYHYPYPHRKKFVRRHVIPETVIIERPIVVERPVVIERPVELRIIEEPILVSPYPTYEEPDDDADVLTIEEPY